MLLNTVLICYLYFIIKSRVHNVFETLWQCIFKPSLLQVALNLARNEASVFPETYALCDGVLVCFQFPRSLVLLLTFTFLAFFCLNLHVGNFSNYCFITCIRNLAILLRWGYLQKQLTTEVSWLFYQKSPS